MEPLITAAIALVTPYLIKTGEKFSESVGEDLWKWIKKPFTGEEESELIAGAKTEEGISRIATLLDQKVKSDVLYKEELEMMVKSAQQKISAYQQNINNTGNIEKQINIQENNGNIQM